MKQTAGRAALGIFLAVVLAGAATQAAGYSKPRVRAITTFVRLERADFRHQIDAALAVLHDAQDEFARAGYQVESIRVVTQPLGELVAGLSDSQALVYLKELDDLSVKENFVPNVGPATLHDADDPRTMRLLAQALSTLPNIEGNAILADEDGIHWRAIRASAALVRYVTDHSAHSHGNVNFAGVAMIKPYGPFYPGTYHNGAGKQLSIGLEGANVVQEVFARTRGDFAGSVAELTKQLTVHATVAAQIGAKVASAHGWTFMGVDPTPAPIADISIGAAIETYTGAKFGSSGTMTAALVITTAVKAIPVQQVGFAGLMLPVMEDKVIGRRWTEGAFNTDSLLAYSAVCGTGLDTIPMPGDVSEEQLARTFGDVASLAWKWKKPLTARLLPVKGKKAGDVTEFGDRYLYNTVVRPLP
jgi:uncharacterized protein (UPF0210 family)